MLQFKFHSLASGPSFFEAWPTLSTTNNNEKPHEWNLDNFLFSSNRERDQVVVYTQTSA